MSTRFNLVLTDLNHIVNATQQSANFYAITPNMNSGIHVSKVSLVFYRVYVQCTETLWRWVDFDIATSYKKNRDKAFCDRIISVYRFESERRFQVLPIEILKWLIVGLDFRQFSWGTPGIEFHWKSWDMHKVNLTSFGWLKLLNVLRWWHFCLESESDFYHTTEMLRFSYNSFYALFTNKCTSHCSGIWPK